MSFTTPLAVVKFLHLTYADVRSESVGTGDGVETNFYTRNKPLWGFGSVTTFVNNSQQNSSVFTTDDELGKIQFTTAIALNSGVLAHYTYSSVSSATLQNFIEFADNYITTTVNDTTDSVKMQFLSDMLTGHLVMKNLAALRARDAVVNYSIGYISVTRGSKEMEMANVYWDNFTNAVKALVKLQTVKGTFQHPASDEYNEYYYNRGLQRDS